MAGHVGIGAGTDGVWWPALPPDAAWVYSIREGQDPPTTGHEVEGDLCAVVGASGLSWQRFDGQQWAPIPTTT